MEKRRSVQAAVLFLLFAGIMMFLSVRTHAGYDTVAPKINSIMINTPTVTKPGIARITFNLTEEETGVTWLSVMLYRKDYKGSEYVTGSIDCQSSPLFSGNNTVSIPVPSSTPSDQYYLFDIQMSDGAGNKVQYCPLWNDGSANMAPYASAINKQGYYEQAIYRLDNGGPIDWNSVVRYNGYLTVQDEFPVAFELSVANPKVASSIASIPAGSGGMIDFTANNAVAKKGWFDAIKGQDKNLVFSNDGIQWVFNGKDIVKNTKDIDLTITSEIKEASEYGGKGNVAVISFADNGELPGKARIRLKANYLLGSGFNLYFENGSEISLERTDGKGYEDGDDRWVEFYVTHNSKFILSKGKLSKSGSIRISVTPTYVKAKVKKNKVTVSWRKIKDKKLLKQINCVQVQYSMDKTFKNAKIKNVKKTKTKVTLKLNKKKTYYIRVRYKGKKGYSRWSKPKKVKTKK